MNEIRKFIVANFRENKLAALILLLAFGLIVYGQVTGTRIYGGNNTEDWHPGGAGQQGHRFYHK